MKKLVLLIMLIMCTSAFSINVENPHLLASGNYGGYGKNYDDDFNDDHDNDDHDNDHGGDDDDDDDFFEDDDDEAPAALVNNYLYLLLIVGCIYAFKTKNIKTKFKK